MRQQVNIPANLIPAVSGTQIYVYYAGTTIPITETIYADATSATTLSNPYTHSGGKVVFYLTKALDVSIGVKPTGAAAPQVAPVVKANSQVPQPTLLKLGSQPVGWFLQ